MQHLLTPERYAKLRSGPQRPSYRRPDPEAGALFVRRRPLRSMTVLVDHDLTSEAADDPQIAYLLGLMAARDWDATPTTPQLRRFWYADEAPPSSAQRVRVPESDVDYVPEWVLVNWSEDVHKRGITYAIGDRVHFAILWDQPAVLDAVTRESPPATYTTLADPHAQMRADFIAA